MTVKNLILGMTLAFVANCIYLSSSFLVGIFKLDSSEICFMKSFVQIFLFSLVALVLKYCSVENTSSVERESLDEKEPDDPEEPEEPDKRWLLFWALVYSVSIGLMTYTAYEGVKLMPVSDFIVLAFSSPVFTLLLSACILGERITVLKAIFTTSIVVGDLLVIQPTFVFGVSESATEAKELSTLGIIVSLLCAFSAALTNVSSSKTRGLPRTILMVFGGVGTLAVTLVSYFTVEASSSDIAPTLSYWERGAISSSIAILSMVGGLILIIACQVISPVVVAVVRASEILMALAVDYAILDGPETPAIYPSLHTVGAIVVVLSVSGIAATHFIERKLAQIFRRDSLINDEEYRE